MNTTGHIVRIGLLALSLAAPGFALAEKPEWAGGGKDKHHKQDKHDKHDKKQAKQGGKQGRDAGQSREIRVGSYFDDRHRQLARTTYAQEYGGGSARKCPPGLAKKNNGCMPPGQAKKYQLGQPLPAGVVVHAVPQPVLVQLPPAPSGHKYVRVAADILLIAVGSSMVIDAITDLARL